MRCVLVDAPQEAVQAEQRANGCVPLREFEPTDDLANLRFRIRDVALASKVATSRRCPSS